MKRFLATFSVLLLIADIANAVDFGGDNTDYSDEILCAPASEYVKCARLPQAALHEGALGNIIIFGSYINGASFSGAATTSDENWSHYRNGIPIAGISHYYRTSSIGPYTQQSANCTIQTPFSADFYVEYMSRTIDYTPPELCANVGIFGTSGENGLLAGWIPTALDGDTCPDGFFTVPYESWCGEGMVNIADTPYCADDASGEYCLMNTIKPCESGISTIKVSTGASFPLYAKKYTEPSLAVQYNGTTCWAKLEAGQQSDTINIRYQGSVYHVVN